MYFNYTKYIPNPTPSKIPDYALVLHLLVGGFSFNHRHLLLRWS